MTAQASLKLVSPQPPDPDDPLKFERRRCIRRPIQGQATSLLSPVDESGANVKICPLKLMNISDSGLGGFSPTPAEIGATMTVCFPSHGADGGFNLDGTVVRCVRRDTEYEIGIQLSQRHAA